ncbi:MAG TPA: hypothetical protein VMZ22_02940 [Acidimicrobiales bacterium]|nr:hypothetical protein [Acidimicrobiales bacterium]
MSVSGTVAGRELVAGWAHIDSCLVGWILKLAEFDRDGLWAIDGFRTCASWLEVNCGMGRSTAKEKVRVAHELTRRPIIRAAFAEGRLPYSKTRVVTRLEGLNDARDEAFASVAAETSMSALELRVKSWNYCNGADAAPDIDDHYGLRRAPGFMDGYGQIVIEGPNDLLDRMVGVVDAYGNFLFHNGPAQLQLHPVDKAPVEPYPQADSEELPKRPSSARRLDLLVDLVEEIALVNADKIDPETAAIGVTVQYEDFIGDRRSLASSDQESMLTGEAVRRLACDAGIHASWSKACRSSSTSAAKPAPGPPRSAAPFAPATTTAARQKAAGVASPTSTTSTGGTTAAKPPSTTAYRCAPTTTTSSTKAAGPSPTSARRR